MYSDDEIDPHRETAHFANPFSDDDDDDNTGSFSRETQRSASNDSQVGESEAESTRAGEFEDNEGDRVIQPAQSQAQGPTPMLTFTVGHLVDRSKRTPVYTFDVITNMTRFKARKYTGVERSQTEFERLETHLQATYPECLVPTLGPGTTSSKYVPEYQNDRLVVHLVQQWLSRVAWHPILRQDYELRQFVEAPFAFNPALSSAPALTMAPSAPPSSGSGFFSWGKSRQAQRITSGATPFEQHLETTATNLGVFQRNAAEVRRWHGRMARTRARLGIDLRDVGTKLVSAGVIEHNAHLARALKRLGKLFLLAGPHAQTQANAEGSRGWAVLGLAAASCGDVQRTLQCRQLIFTEHQVAQRQLDRKKQAAAVLRSSTNISPEHAQDAVSELAQAKADADNRRLRAERVDRVLEADLAAFGRCREGDVRHMLAALARDHLSAERQVLAEQRAALEFVRQGRAAARQSAAPLPSGSVSSSPR
ncbi:Vacuolar protein sorting-associated protein 17 [Kickxella alabastrina]|uniref:Vacuolar protein sorting-associated protein 17 n=1 Tax=Kickxella alabastrina TaxID=61397 RepID=A0ACC1IKQ0_9FUNG|nr:Vacuolar protein sorting-associated protein 17 [Kickxella alabastrina]